MDNRVKKLIGANMDIVTVSGDGQPDLVHKLVLAVTLSKNNDIVKQAINNWIAIAEIGACCRYG